MSGVFSKIAIAKGATWGTLPTLSTGHRAPFTSSTLQKAIGQIPDDDLKGRATRGPSSLGAETVPGQISWLGDYRQRAHLLMSALFMGSAGVPTTVETGVYLHVFAFQPTTDGLFAGIGVDLAGKDVHGFKSVKPVRRTIRIAGGGRWEESVEVVGAGLDKTIASSGWTYTYDPNGNGARRVLASQTVCRVNAHAGGALGAGDVVKPREISVTMARAMEQDFPVGQVHGEEPILGDFAEVTVSLTFFGITAALLVLFRDSMDSGVALKMDLVATHGTLLGSTEYRRRALYFPKLIVTDCPTEIPGPGPVPVRVTMTAHYSDAVPTGFPSGYDEEVTEEAQNEISTDLLA